MIPIHLLNIAWQSMLLSASACLVVVLLLRDARRRAWMAALGILVAVLAPFFMLAWPAPKAEPLISLSPEPAPEWKPNWTVKVQPIPARPVQTQRVIAQPVWNWSDLVLPTERVWMSGVLLLLLWNGFRTAHAWRWHRQLSPGPRHRVHSFEGTGSPCVVGLLHPRIAVPKKQNFSEEQWRWLLAHEGEHMRGCDAAMAWLFEWARAWLWWNPFVHALISAWSQAREEVCDAVAVKSTEDGERYANFLIEIASAHPTSGALAMAASRPARRLKARLLAVLDGRRVCERVGLGFATLATCVIGGAMVIVSCSGVRVDEPVSPKAIHLFTVFVEPTDFVARVAEMRRQGYVVEEPSSDERLGAVSVAILKNAKGERTEVRKDVTANQILTRIYKVAPDFLSKAGTGKTAKQTLEACGIAFPEGSSAFYNPTTSQLIVKHTAATLHRLEQVINDLQVTLPMAYLQTKIIEGSELFGEAGHIYDDAKFQPLIRGFAQKKGVDLMSAPAVTAKLGQPASIEVGREIFNASKTETKFLGVRVELDPSSGPEGTLKLKGKLELSDYFGEDVRVSPNVIEFQPPRTFDSVKQWDKPFEAQLKPGQTVAVHLGEKSKGRFVSMFITARAIKPDGKDAKRFDENLATPLQSVHVSNDSKSLSEKDEKAAMRDAAKAEEQQAKRQVYLTAKIVDLTTEEAATALTPEAKKSLKIPSFDSTIRPEKPKLPRVLDIHDSNSQVATAPGVFSLSGVLTDPQFQVVIRALSQKQDIAMLLPPSATVKSGDIVKLASGNHECAIEAAIGPDGYTIDLTINYVNKAKNEQHVTATTSVTIWDGQTVVLGGITALAEKDMPERSRLIFVTGKIIDPTGQPKSKTKP